MEKPDPVLGNKQVFVHVYTGWFFNWPPPPPPFRAVPERKHLFYRRCSLSLRDQTKWRKYSNIMFNHHTLIFVFEIHGFVQLVLLFLTFIYLYSSPIPPIQSTTAWSFVKITYSLHSGKELLPQKLWILALPKPNSAPTCWDWPCCAPCLQNCFSYRYSAWPSRLLKPYLAYPTFHNHNGK